MGSHPKFWWQEGALDPPGGRRARRSRLGMPGTIPLRQGRGYTQGRRGGRAAGKLILKFPSCEIEAHVPIMKYFLPFHGSSVIPDGSEPGKTDPPCSHPRRLTARQDKQGLRSAGPGCFPTFQHPPNTAPHPLRPPPARKIHISEGISVQGCRNFSLPPPAAPVSPGLPPPARAAAFIYFGIMRFFQLL